MKDLKTLKQVATRKYSLVSLEFEKSITRDWGIIYSQIWHEVFTSEFKKQIGWGYTEVVFEGKENTITVYRAPSEHIEGMRNFILDKLNKDPKWIAKKAGQVEKQVNETIKWADSIKQRPWSSYNSKELADILELFIKKNIKLGPRFIIMLWFPIQMENHQFYDKYKLAVEKAISTRVVIEKIGPLSDSFGREIASEMAERAGGASNLARFISFDEILDYLRKEKAIDKNRLMQRQKYFIFCNDGILSTPVEDYLKSKGFLLKRLSLGETNEIKGNVAYRGIAKGTAKIIKNRESFGKLQEGDVLITGMTTPDYLPVLKKAVAFVTDEGGITCHAAIVARELKKPCIIGTKIATQFLKDGDYVEVDADKGIVRIIEKAGK